MKFNWLLKHLKWLEREVRRSRLENKSLNNIYAHRFEEQKIKILELENESKYWHNQFNSVMNRIDSESEQVFNSIVMKDSLNYIDPRYGDGNSIKERLIEQAKQDLISHIAKDCKYFSQQEDDHFIHLSLKVKKCGN